MDRERKCARRKQARIEAMMHGRFSIQSLRSLEIFGIGSGSNTLPSISTAVLGAFRST